MDTLVSVIVPVYNVERYLKKCVDSILAQTYANLEIILVDDGATDTSGKMCDEYKKADPRIVVVHKENGGLASARNAGLKAAHGEYIAYVDSDDWVEPDFVERLLSTCVGNDADVSICRYEDCYSEEPFSHEEEQFTRVWSGKDAVRHRVLDEAKYCISTSACNKFYKRELIADMCFPEGKYYEDIVYGVQAMLRANRVAYINRSLYHYRCARQGSIMNEGFNPRIITDELPLMSERNQLIREAGLTDIADLVDRNYCIRVIEIARKVSAVPDLQLRIQLDKQCRDWFSVVYKRCGKCNFTMVDKGKVLLYQKTPKLGFCLFNMVAKAKAVTERCRL